jgi:hypothetical protein
MISHSTAPKYFWERKDGWTDNRKHKKKKKLMVRNEETPIILKWEENQKDPTQKKAKKN